MKQLTDEDRPQVATATPWTPQEAEELYGIRRWGLGYFHVNEAGHVVVRPDTTGDQEIDLHEVIEGLRERDLTAPVLLRFGGVLEDRLRRLHQAFAEAIEENHYTGHYQAVFPVKVNQQRTVVERVIRGGAGFQVGLEAGSKPELLTILGLTTDCSDRLVICNGFKDEGYIKAAVLASKLGRPVIPVVENFDELRLILKLAERHDVRPRLGVRVKLLSQGAGRWRHSLGARSKFGLFVSEVLKMLEILRERGMEDCLELVHCHPGSQIKDIRRVKEAIHELCQIYTELVQLAPGLRIIDVGGGLGVDYVGTSADSESSLNYTLEEYASDVVYGIASACDQKDVPHPTIVSESGRAMVAHHSVLVFDVLGSAAPGERNGLELPVEGKAEHLALPLVHLLDAHDSVAPDKLAECYHDATLARRQAVELFKLGQLSIKESALAERLFWTTCRKIRDEGRKLDETSDELRELELVLSETYYCNVSVFQSLPDSWAIDQLFPILPVHRLNEKPSVKAVLVDLTCDSDGRIDRFPGREEIEKTLDLHPLVPGKSYYLGAFLVGAYQETLGDLHNLFGDTHVVQIEFKDGGWWVEEVVYGDTAREVLGYVQHDVDRFQPRLHQECEEAVRAQRMTVQEAQAFLRFYKAELDGYTYLEPETE